MTNEEMTELLAGTYQRQYHHNTYPELSDNSEFVTSKEEIKKACIQIAKWKEKQMIEKACDYLYNNIDKDLIIYHDNTWLKLDAFVKRFKKAMEE